MEESIVRAVGVARSREIVVAERRRFVFETPIAIDRRPTNAGFEVDAATLRHGVFDAVLVDDRNHCQARIVVAKDVVKRDGTAAFHHFVVIGRPGHIMTRRGKIPVVATTTTTTGTEITAAAQAPAVRRNASIRADTRGIGSFDDAFKYDPVETAAATARKRGRRRQVVKVIRHLVDPGFVVRPHVGSHGQWCIGDERRTTVVGRDDHLTLGNEGVAVVERIASP